MGTEIHYIFVSYFIFHLIYKRLWDEATSSIDSITETEILDAIDSFAVKMTCIIITHDIVSTYSRVDKIIVMNNDQIAEYGTHKELMEKESGIYRKMFETQLHTKIANKIS